MPLKAKAQIDLKMFLNSEKKKGDLGNWEGNKAMTHFILQDTAKMSPDANSALKMFKTFAILASCVPDALYQAYAAIAGTYNDENCKEYNNIVKQFRENVGKIDPSLGALVEPRHTTIKIAAEDRPIVRSALAKIAGHQKTVGGGTGGTVSEDAIRSYEEISVAIKSGADMALLAPLYRTGKGDRLQSACNQASRVNDQVILDALKTINIIPQSGKGVARDPNSHNIDYLFLLALIARHFNTNNKIANKEATWPQFLRLLTQKISKSNVDCSAYTGIPACTIPSKLSLREVGPQAMTDKRVTNALLACMWPEVNNEYTNPEIISGASQCLESIVAISTLINQLDPTHSNFDNNMWQLGRWLRQQMLDKQGFACVNFLKINPFSITLDGTEPPTKEGKTEQAAEVAQKNDSKASWESMRDVFGLDGDLPTVDYEKKDARSIRDHMSSGAFAIDMLAKLKQNQATDAEIATAIDAYGYFLSLYYTKGAKKYTKAAEVFLANGIMLSADTYIDMPAQANVWPHGKGTIDEAFAVTVAASAAEGMKKKAGNITPDALKTLMQQRKSFIDGEDVYIWIAKDSKYAKSARKEVMKQFTEDASEAESKLTAAEKAAAIPI